MLGQNVNRKLTLRSERGEQAEVDRSRSDVSGTGQPRLRHPSLRQPRVQDGRGGRGDSVQLSVRAGGGHTV